MTLRPGTIGNSSVSVFPASAPSPDVEAHTHTLCIFQIVRNPPFTENGEIEENMKTYFYDPKDFCFKNHLSMEK